ncbi:hypothetical protein MNB_SV-6-114 [hydrothermal vent metagenome]|uniref:Uncharacterized protein n=1 Tax=hydrothermal vent metagenome TaxID=652676 RepID=A0A1W1BW52_9ZZZZ
MDIYCFQNISILPIFFEVMITNIRFKRVLIVQILLWKVKLYLF